MDARLPAQSVRDLPEQADAHVGRHRAARTRSTSTTSTTSCARPSAPSSSWDDVPDDIKRTFDRLGIPEAERKFLSGVSAQYESEVVYHSVIEELEKDGVLFCDMDTALKQYPEIVKKYFATVIPPGDNKFAALNSAVWSGGSFVYVPPRASK